MHQSRIDTIICIFIFLISVFIFTQGLSIHGLEYRDDEIFYYKSTSEMLRTGNFLSPTYFGENRFQKPILYYWLVLLSYKIFGTNWLGARFVAVVFAGLTVCLTWLMGKNLFSRRVGALGAIILMTTPLFFRHAKNAVPDMPLNFFIVWAVYCAIRFIQCSHGTFGKFAENESPAKWNMLFFVACALGFMIKGFAALIVPFLTVIVFALYKRNLGLLKKMKFGRGIGVMLLIISPWFIYMVMVHGRGYLDYMLVDETKNRLVNTGGGNFVITIIKTFFNHCLFYLNVIGSYFAPWCVFLIGAIPMSLVRIRTEKKEGLRLLLIWFCAVFFFFSTMYFCINHYMLVLSTPFALLVAYFFLADINTQSTMGKITLIFRKYFPVFILTACVLAFAFLSVFLSGSPKWWLAVLLVFYVLSVKGIHQSLRPMTAPLVLGLFMIFVFAQSSLLERAGVTSHAALQKFAVTVNNGLENNTVIGVGSHDIHEKEFQVYFDRRVIKAAGSEDDETRDRLNKLLAENSDVYCLLTEKDYNHFLKDAYADSIEVVQNDLIMRKRMEIDKEFFLALIRLDREAVHHYLKEKVVLIRKRSNV